MRCKHRSTKEKKIWGGRYVSRACLVCRRKLNPAGWNTPTGKILIGVVNRGNSHQRALVLK